MNNDNCGNCNFGCSLGPHRCESLYHKVTDNTGTEIALPLNNSNEYHGLSKDEKKKTKDLCENYTHPVGIFHIDENSGPAYKYKLKAIKGKTCIPKDRIVMTNIDNLGTNLTEGECKKYADDNNYRFLKKQKGADKPRCYFIKEKKKNEQDMDFSGNSLSNLVDEDSEDTIIFNTNSNGSNRRDICKGQRYSIGGCITKISSYNEKIEAISDGKNICTETEVNSCLCKTIRELDCKNYADEHETYDWNSASSWTDRPRGCILHTSTNRVFYNNNSNVDHSCNYGGFNCIQRKLEPGAACSVGFTGSQVGAAGGSGPQGPQGPQGRGSGSSTASGKGGGTRTGGAKTVSDSGPNTIVADPNIVMPQGPR